MKRRKDGVTTPAANPNTVFINSTGYKRNTDSINLWIGVGTPFLYDYMKYKPFFYSLCIMLFNGLATISYTSYESRTKKEKRCLLKKPIETISFCGYPDDIVSSLEKNNYGCTYTSIPIGNTNQTIYSMLLKVYCPITGEDYVRDIYYNNDMPPRNIHLDLRMETTNRDSFDKEQLKNPVFSSDDSALSFELNPYEAFCYLSYDKNKYTSEFITEIIKKAAEENGLCLEETT